MPIRLISGGGGSVSLNPDTTTSALNLTVPAENGTVITSGATSRIIPKAAVPAGSVIQVINVMKVDQWTTASTSATDITGMSLSITPTFNTSKILIQVSVCISLTGGGGDGYVRLLRDGNLVGNGGGGFFGQVAGQDYFQGHFKTISYLDSPATLSSVNYKVQGWVGGNTLWVNGRGLDGGFNTSSSMVAMEIAQ